jgi:hypothetical protein
VSNVVIVGSRARSPIWYLISAGSLENREPAHVQL